MSTNVPGHNDELTFPPIPLATGQVFHGVEHRIASMEIVVTMDDGTESRIPLEPRLGGWWVPAAT